MSVYLDPNNSLGFNRPLTVMVKKNLTITNRNSQPVAFKVKTTAPKLYCVRPNSGRVEPGQSVEVSVMLQALKEEPPLNAKCKDKFLIQSTFLTPAKEAMPQADIWAAPEGAPEDMKVHQQKLKVVYLPPEGQILPEEDETQVNQSSMLEEQPYDTVRADMKVNGHPAPIPSRFISPDPGMDTAAEDEPADADAVAPVSVVVQPPAEPEPVVEKSPRLSPTLLPDDELQARLKDAQAEIERLRSLLAAAAPPPELRKRRHEVPDDAASAVSASETAVTMTEELPVQEGVPLQVVVILCLGVFITTYLFF